MLEARGPHDTSDAVHALLLVQVCVQQLGLLPSDGVHAQAEALAGQALQHALQLTRMFGQLQLLEELAVALRAIRDQDRWKTTLPPGMKTAARSFI